MAAKNRRPKATPPERQRENPTLKEIGWTSYDAPFSCGPSVSAALRTLVRELEALQARVAELEAKVGRS